MATVREVLTEMAKALPVEPPSSAASRKEKSVVRDKGKGKKTKEAQQTPVCFHPCSVYVTTHNTAHKSCVLLHQVHRRSKVPSFCSSQVGRDDFFPTFDGNGSLCLHI